MQPVIDIAVIKEGFYMNYSFTQYKVRKYLRRNRETMEEEIVSVSNVNKLTVGHHMELLNLNDDKYEYIKYIGDVTIKE